MKTFKEIIESLKEKVKAKIKPESSQEELDEINGLVGELDSLENSHNELVTENAKFKDTIVRMVTTQGDGNQPKDTHDGSKPMSIEECIAEVQKEGK